MELETGTIKGNKTKYFNKSENKEVVKYSKYVNLGVNSAFDIGDKAVVLPINLYDDLINSNKDNIKQLETIKELNNTIADKDNTIADLTNKVANLNDEIRTISTTNTSNATRIADLTTELKAVELELTAITTVMKQYNITSADELNTIFNDVRTALNYLSDCITAYETQGRIKRFLKENPTIDIAKPPLMLMDYKGNINTGNGAEISATKVNDSNKSE